MAYGIIYLLIDGTNDKEYVGQTTKTLKKRFNQHKRGDQLIDRIIQKRGEDLFTTAVLKECDSKAELDFWERHMILSRNTMIPNGYNLTEGGDGLSGLKFTPEHCAKIAAALTDKKRPAEVIAKFAATKRFYSPFKNLLREIENRQLTYKILAERLGLANVSTKIRGKRNFTEKDVARLAEFFGLSAEYLLKRDDGVPLVLSEVAKSTNISKAQRGESPYKNLLCEMDKHYISYKSLAELLGLAKRTVSDKMLGECYFTEKDVAKLVEFFGLSAEYLMARTDELPATTSKTEKCARLSAINRHSSYKNLLSEMDKRKITYRALGELLGLSHQTVSEKMRRKIKFSEKEVTKLVEIFDKPAEYLMARDD